MDNYLGLYHSDLNRLRTVEKTFENEEEAWATDQVVVDAFNWIVIYLTCDKCNEKKNWLIWNFHSKENKQHLFEE